MDRVQRLDLPTGEYTFRPTDELSGGQALSALIGGSEIHLYDVVGPAGADTLEVAAVPGATPLADNEVGTVFRLPSGEALLTLEDRNWARSYTFYSAAEGAMVATMRKSWYAFGRVEVRDQNETLQATVGTEGLLPPLGSQPKPRHITTPNDEPVGQLEHTQGERLNWRPTVMIHASVRPPLLVLAVSFAIAETMRSEREGTTGPTQ